MRASRWPLVLLMGLFVFTPFAFASTFEAWTDGIYDAETDEILQAARCPEAVVECAPVLVAGHVAVVVTLACAADDSTASAAVPPARPSRAPPTS